MTISIGSFARQSLLLLLCGSAIGVLANAIINNQTKSSLSKPAAFDFPQTIPLSGSSMLATKPLTPHSFKGGMVATGQSYRYQHQPKPIEIEIRYITDGVANPPSMKSMVPIFTKVPATALQPSTIKEQPGLGFYSLFVDKKVAYFGTCINPYGITTVTEDQFHANTNPNLFAQGVSVNRLLPWLLGKQTLRDNRCLWTLLSTPIDEASPDATMKTLETVGLNWIRWWQVHFPSA
jgi:cyanosortase A-associated protein